MITNYVGSHNTEHHITEYTLTTGKVVTLTEDEADELCQFIDKTKYASSVDDYTDPEGLEKYLRDLLGSHTYSLNVLDK